MTGVPTRASPTSSTGVPCGVITTTCMLWCAGNAVIHMIEVTGAIIAACTTVTSEMERSSARHDYPLSQLLI